MMDLNKLKRDLNSNLDMMLMLQKKRKLMHSFKIIGIKSQMI